MRDAGVGGRPCYWRGASVEEALKGAHNLGNRVIYARGRVGTIVLTRDASNLSTSHNPLAGPFEVAWTYALVVDDLDDGREASKQLVHKRC